MIFTFRSQLEGVERASGARGYRKERKVTVEDAREKERGDGRCSSKGDPQLQIINQLKLINFPLLG
jgi:hypothetical protein